MIAGLAYGESIQIGAASVSLHPAGHVLGSAQVWITHGYADVLARFLTEKGIAARAIKTQFIGETDDPAKENPAPDALAKTANRPVDDLVSESLTNSKGDAMQDDAWEANS